MSMRKELFRATMMSKEKGTYDSPVAGGSIAALLLDLEPNGTSFRLAFTSLYLVLSDRTHSVPGS